MADLHWYFQLFVNSGYSLITGVFGDHILRSPPLLFYDRELD